MRVVPARTWSAEEVAEAYALWWREAGLHSATSAQAHGWLAEPAMEARAPVPQARVAEPTTVTPIRQVTAPIAARASTQGMPGDLTEFCAWLGHDQPESDWSGPLYLPPEALNARLLVLVDMPDDEPAGPLMPLAAPAARFLSAMLAAIGVSDEDSAVAPLAMRRPPGGLLDEKLTATLAARMRHYLGLARPRAAIILGDRTSRALIAAQVSPSIGNLPEINHAAGTLPVAALAGPQLLMTRPLAKAASWQTLRLLHDLIGN